MTQLAHQVRRRTDDPLALAASRQEQYELETPISHRKERGQFFTPPAVAVFMAGLLSLRRNRMRILDAGAGAGTLSAAVCKRVAEINPHVSVELVLYESGRRIVPLLEETMKRCRSMLHAAGREMSFAIRTADFILENRLDSGQGRLFEEEVRRGDFDAAVMNPPYFKLRRCSVHARAFEGVIRGQPNIYALFMATAAAMLRPGGELVAITPRSFCNGLYFREFRRWFFERMVLRHVHLFESRTETFKSADVLQESVITLWKKGGRADDPIVVTSSFGADLARATTPIAHPSARVVDRTLGDFVIRIPADRIDARVMGQVESWRARFVDHGLRISTGPVVTFRANRYLLTELSAGAVPLIFPHNIRPFETHWPVVKNGKPTAFRVCSGSARLVLPTRNYVLLRRFSAKEERRRLVASCVLASEGRWPAQIAIENHVNYVYHGRRELSEAEAFGLAALFNSALIDRYFRTQSGNTQVNATEIRAMPFPTLSAIAEIGSRAKALLEIGHDDTERVVLDVLGVRGSLAKELLGTR